jgi:hypothetical protein
MNEVTFGFNESTSEVGGKFIQITPETAISEGRFIESLEFIEDGDKSRFKIVVKNAQGQTAQKSWFEPKLGGFVDEKVLKTKVSQFNGVMANLSRRFLGETYVPQGVTNFESLCKVVIKDIGSKYEGKELRIKCVYDKNGFPTLPNVAPIFENLETTPSKLSVNTKYDVVVSTYKPTETPDADIPPLGEESAANFPSF